MFLNVRASPINLRFGERGRGRKASRQNDALVEAKAETPPFGLFLVRRYVPLIELDRHDAQHVSPVRLVQQNLAQFGLGGFSSQEKVQRSVE